MDQFFLKSTARAGRRLLCQVVCVSLLMGAAFAGERTKQSAPELVPQDILMDGGRKLTFERTFSDEREVKSKRGFWTKVVDIVAGEPDYHFMERPYGIAVDSHGRIIVTDPGAEGIHIFDFVQQKYRFVQRREKNKDSMLAPQCVAVDAQDNIYVTDSESGKIFVFGANGKFLRAVGSLPGGEGYFKRPTGIAVDSEAQHIYVTDTLRNKIFMLDMEGKVLKVLGENGTANGQFNFPTDLLLDEEGLSVVDSMNFRVQNLNRQGDFQYAIGRAGEEPGMLFRPKGIARDSEDHLYVVDALQSTVQVFDRDGELLYSFGGQGTDLGEFQLPAGLFIDHNDRVYVVDSYNRRVQQFHYFAAPKQAEGGGK
jgi:DNA-binding beta-propeller fold protein YncE